MKNGTETVLMNGKEYHLVDPEKIVGKPKDIPLSIDDDSMIEAMQNQIDSSDYLLGVIKKLTEKYEKVSDDNIHLLGSLQVGKERIASLQEDLGKEYKEKNDLFGRYEKHLKTMTKVVNILFGKESNIGYGDIVEAVKKYNKCTTKNIHKLAGINKVNQIIVERLERIGQVCDGSGIEGIKEIYLTDEKVDRLLTGYKNQCTTTKGYVTLIEKYHKMTDAAGFDQVSPNLGDKLNVLIQDRDDYAEDVQKEKNKASKYNSEKLQILKQVKKMLNKGQLKRFQNEYDLWKEERK